MPDQIIPVSLLHAMVASTNYAVITTRTDGLITVFNHAAERLLGWRADELIGTESPAVFHDAGEVASRAAELSAQVGRLVEPGFEVFILEAREGVVADEREWTYVRKDGGRVPVLLAVTALRDGDRVVGYLLVARDLSELRRAQHRIVEGEQRFRAIFEAAVDCIFVIEERGQIIDVNPAAQRLFGWAAAELIGRNISMIMPPEVATAHDGHLTRYHETGERRVIGTVRRVTALRQDGSSFPADLTVSEGRIDGRRIFVGTLHDATSQVAGEDAMRRAREVAEAANQAKSDFLSNVSHEIRTPLNGVVGMSGLLLDSVLTPTQRDQAETIRACSDQLLVLINDLLDFAKIEAGRLELERIAFDPLLVAEEAVALLAGRAADKGLEIHLEPAPGLPPMLLGDPGRIRQVIVNLVANAVKFSDQGEVVVALGPGASEGTMQVAVTDSGLGMAAETLAKLFRPFTQADTSTTRRFGGTGLGLSISRRLVELMGGTIAVRSQLGSGSCFTFTVHCPRVAGAGPAVAALPGGAGRRVLVIDDRQASRQLLDRILTSWGLVVVEAGSGPEGLASARQAAADGAPFAVIISDQHRPGLAALAVAEVLGGDPATAAIPHLLLGPATDRAFHERAIALGVHEVLPRPVRQARLLDALRRLFAGGGPVRRAVGPEVRFTGRVLVVDDNAVNQRVATALCVKLGLHTEAVGDGGAAVAATARGRYDLVLMDCQMPDLDGYEATQAIRRREQAEGTARVPIVALTAHAMAGERARCLAAGMDGHIAKPIRLDDLITALRRWLPGSATGRPVLDPAVLASLRRELGEDAERLIAEMLAIFAEDAGVQLQVLHQATSLQEIGRCVHRLRGSALSVGAVELTAACTTVEAAAEIGDEATARAGVQRIVDEIARARAALTTSSQA